MGLRRRARWILIHPCQSSESATEALLYLRRSVARRWRGRVWSSEEAGNHALQPR